MESTWDRFTINEDVVVGKQRHLDCLYCRYQMFAVRRAEMVPMVMPIYLSRPAFRCILGFHFPMVKNSLSPTSPRPGLIIPRSSTCPSRPPTQTSTDSLPFSSAARLTPSTLPSTLITTTFFTPHSRSVCMAALEVPPVAITGSKSKAIEGNGDGSGLTDVGRWYGRLL